MPYNTVILNRTLPIRYDVDVFVAGGGPAGVAAAVTAARQGMKTYLAEGHSCLGGMGTAALVPCFIAFTDGVNFTAAGIGKEIHHMLQESGGAVPGHPWAIKSEALKIVYDNIVKDAEVQLSFHTMLNGVEAEAGEVNYAILSSKNGLFAVKAKIYIDATGDGDLCAWAGATFEKGDANGGMMAGTLCSLWSGIEWDKVKGPDDRKLEDAMRDGVFSVNDRHLPGIFRTGDKIGTGNLGHLYGLDGTDDASVTKALIYGRRMLQEYESYYKNYLEGFEHMELAATASLLGVRETRRIIGDYVLSLEDFRNKSVFDDEIGRFSSCVDLHASDSDRKSYDEYYKYFNSLKYNDGDSYGIPYRILTPKNLKNVLVSGRCASMDRMMNSSLRMMPGSFITGQAAGMAAAVAVKENTHTRGFEVSKLQKKLKEAGAFLPNFKSG